MRTEYVIRLQGRMTGRINQLEGESAKPTSTAHLKKMQKELEQPSKSRRLSFDLLRKAQSSYADKPDPSASRPG